MGAAVYLTSGTMQRHPGELRLMRLFMTLFTIHRDWQHRLLSAGVDLWSLGSTINAAALGYQSRPCRPRCSWPQLMMPQAFVAIA